MTRFVVLTDQPERLEREYGGSEGWPVVAHRNAVEEFLWQRRMLSSGACVLHSRGRWHGVTFTRTRPAGHGPLDPIPGIVIANQADPR